MNGLSSTLLIFLVAATSQNVVLSTGFGASSMLKIARRPDRLLRFGGWLILFSVTVTALFYPLDLLLPIDSVFWQLFRPFLIILLTTILYVAVWLITKKWLPEWHRRARHLLPLAAFNNLVVGVALVINRQVSLAFFPAIGLSAGASVGFLLLSAITAEGISRLDNPDIPKAFRGIPATLLYLGLLALALMGFSPILNLI